MIWHLCCGAVVVLCAVPSPPAALALLAASSSSFLRGAKLETAGRFISALLLVGDEVCRQLQVPFIFVF
jgi:hypothetical protein